MAEEEPSRGRSALVLGATGLVGRHCVELLLSGGRYEIVRVLGRRRLPLQHPRLEQHVHELSELESLAHLFAVSDVFCCLGTTISSAGSQEAFRTVDVEYPVTAAGLATDAGADQFLVISALGADPESRIFYNRMKGEMESQVRRFPLKAIWVIRPALLIGDREETRVGERVAEIVLRPISPLLIGPLRRFRPVSARDVARAMVNLASQDGTGGFIESEQIEAIARRA